MSLKDKVVTILAELETGKKDIANNHKYIRVIEDQLSAVLYEEVYSKLSSKTARRDKQNMSVNINILKKVKDKLSQLYTNEPERSVESDQEQFDYLVKSINPDSAMQRGSELFNTSKSVLMEIYKNSKFEIKWRPLPNDRYFLWTDDLVEDNVATVVVKIMSDISYKDEGKQIDTVLYFMYSDEEMVAVDGAGRFYPQYMQEDMSNPLGFLPFTHISQEEYNLMVNSDYDSLGNILGVNSILTDAVCGNHYLSFPMVIGSNLDVDQCTFSKNADDINIIQSPEGSDKEAKIEVIATKLDTEKSTKLAMEILQLYLDSKGVIANAGNAQANASGVSLMIENADTTDVKKTQIMTFTPKEQELWEKSAQYYNWLLDNKASLMPKKAPKKKFSDDFEVAIDFGNVDSVVDQMQEVEEGKDKKTSDEE